MCSQRKRKRLEEEEQESKKPKTAEDSEPEKKVEQEVEKEEVTSPDEKTEQRVEEEKDSEIKDCEDKSEILRTLTSYYCKTCSGEPSLCPVPCFELYHTRLIYKTAPELERQVSLLSNTKH